MQKNLERYMQEIGQIPLISTDEEKFLARRRDEGDEDARNKLIASNLRLVVKIAHDYKGYGIPLNDLISEGNLGLMRAVEKFDPSKGKFASYAGWWINQKMRMKVREKDRVIRLPSTYLNKLNKVKYARHKLYEKLNREPTIKEISKATKMTTRKIEKLLEHELNEVSIHDPVVIGENASLEDIVGKVDESFKDNEDKDSLKRVRRLIKYLDDREQYIIAERFGLSGKVKTLEEISQKTGITRERVRQIQNRSLEKIRTKIKEEDIILKQEREYISREFFDDDLIPIYSFLTPEEKIVIDEHNRETIPTLIDLSETLESTISYAKNVEKEAIKKIKDFINFKLTFNGKVYNVENQDMIYGIECKSNFEKEINELNGKNKEVLECLYIKHFSYKQTAEKIDSIPCKVEIYETDALKEICKKINLI